MPKDIEKKIRLLHDFFREDSNITFAYLFGGLVKERKSPLHDVDVAVYVKDIKRFNYMNLMVRLSSFLGTDEIDLVVLNISPLSLTGRIVQSRRVIIDKNPFLRHRFESDILRKYFDFSIKERDILQRRYGIG